MDPVPAPSRPLEAISVARVVLGAGLLAKPTPLLAIAGGDAGSRRARQVARLLGVRQVLQGAVSIRRPTTTVALLGVAADALHSLSMVGLGLLDRDQRRVALTDAAVAASFAAAGVFAAKTAGS